MTGSISDVAAEAVRIGIDALGASEDVCLVMTGQTSYKASSQPPISEAQAMKDYATLHGVTSKLIFTEAESKDTLGNLLFSRQNVIDPLHITDVIVVRSANHSQERVEYLANKVFGQNYTLRVIGPRVNNVSAQEREGRSLAMAKQWLESVVDGDAAAIYSLMRKDHPAYTHDVKLDTLQQIF